MDLSHENLADWDQEQLFFYSHTSKNGPHKCIVTSTDKQVFVLSRLLRLNVRNG